MSLKFLFCFTCLAVERVRFISSRILHFYKFCSARKRGGECIPILKNEQLKTRNVTNWNKLEKRLNFPASCRHRRSVLSLRLIRFVNLQVLLFFAFFSIVRVLWWYLSIERLSCYGVYQEVSNFLLPKYYLRKQAHQSMLREEVFTAGASHLLSRFVRCW